jgi:2-haloacid dehalogenase
MTDEKPTVIMQKKTAKTIKAGQETNGPNVEAIVFDAYGTLFDLDSFARDAEKVHRGKGKEIARIVRQKQLEFALTRTILGKYTNFEILTRNAIEFALKETGIKRTDQGVENLFSKFQSLRFYKDVLGTLTDLDELNMRVAILSNGTQSMLDKLMEHTDLSLLSEGIISIDEAKAYKPSPKAYLFGQNELEIFEKEKVFYISGNTWDVAGAKAFGFLVGWINRTKQPLFDEGFYEFRPDFEFSTLGDIPKLFG